MEMHTSFHAFAIVSLLSFQLTLALDDDAYMALSARIEGLDMEVKYLRNELASTKTRIENIENQKPEKERKMGDAADELHPNFTSKAQQYMNIMKLAWKQEKMQSKQHKERMDQKLLETKSNLEEQAANTDADISALRDTIGDNGVKLKTFSRSLGDIEFRCVKLETEQKRLETFKSETQRFIMALTARLDETTKELSNVRASLGNRVEYLTTQMDQQEKCQSGTVGAADYPSRVFPYTKTVRFHPPFKQAPNFVCGPVYLDSGYVRFDASLKRLTKDLFTLEIVTWEAYDLWGLKFRWMACPK